MKRNRDEEKIMGPMFPRLHVNDTDKGGPRAPPRNKMALYEHFTIPSQRYNSGVVPPKPSNDSGYNSSLVPSTSASQGTGRERKTYHNLYRPPTTTVHEEIHACDAGALSLNNQPLQAENKKKPVEEDDFMVPIFSQAGTETCIEKRSRNDINCQEHPVSKQRINNHVENTNKVSNSSRTSFDILINQEQRALASLHNTGTCLREDHMDGLQAVDVEHHADVPAPRRKNPCQDTTLRLTINPQAGCRLTVGDEINNGTDRIEGDECPEKESVDRGDGVSETSIVDSASEFDITPDDVVDIIGRKHFWKARSAIVNQQRVLAVQLFELHRLLKVQKLIAASPNFLLETTAFVAKSSRKETTSKKYPSECAVKDVSLKPTDKAEGTAENAVPKAPSQPIPTQQNPIPIQPANINMDPIINPWAFHQPPTHQWLVPVMSPSEGLVYKPFPASAFTGPLIGGCGPMGPNPVPANLMNPTYMGMQPGVHFGGQNYFPPYGMRMMTPTVSNSTVVQPQPYSQSDQPEGGSVNRGQKNVIYSLPRDVHGSTASSPSDREQREATVPQSEGIEKRAGVIRAVPHRSTRESAARIFQSIQQERRANESS